MKNHKFDTDLAIRLLRNNLVSRSYAITVLKNRNMCTWYKDLQGRVAYTRGGTTAICLDLNQTVELRIHNTAVNYAWLAFSDLKPLPRPNSYILVDNIQELLPKELVIEGSYRQDLTREIKDFLSELMTLKIV